MKILFVTAVVAISIFSSCQKRDADVRIYVEKSISSDMMKPEATKSNATLSKVISGARYQLPDGWTAKPGSGMRLAEFQKGELSATLIRLDGNGGGLEANIRRWLAQIKLTPSASEMSGILESIKATSNGKGIQTAVVDLTPYVISSSDNAIIGSVIQSENQVYFFKCLGRKSTLLENRISILSLASSITPENL